MPYQDFVKRLQGPPQPLTLPEYDLPSQIEPVDAHQAAVEKIFGKSSRPNFAVDVPDDWNVEEQKPQAQLGKPPKYRTLKDLLPKKQKTRSAKPPANTGTMSGTVTARNPLTGSAFDPRPRANNEFDLSLGGPTEAEQMAERAIREAKSPSSLLEKREADKAQAASESRLERGNVARMGNGAPSSRNPVYKEKTFEERQRVAELQRMRKQVESENFLTRLGRRFVTTAAGGLKPDEEFINAPVGRVEDAVNSVLDSATRGLASIPEGFGRIADYVMNTDTLEATKGLAQMAKDPNLTPEERANIQARIDQLHGSLSKIGDYAEPISKMGDAAAKGLYPRDPNAEETINPLKADFWSHTMPGAAGSMLPFMAAGGVGNALKLSPRLVAGAAGAAMEVPEGYHEARAAGATPEQLQQVTATRIASGGIESLGAESLLGGVGKKLEGSMFGHVTKEGVVEAVQEGGQSATSDLGDKYYSKTKPELTAGQITMNALQNAVPALFLGAGGGAMGVPARLAEQKQKQIAQQIEQLATAEPDHPVAQTIAAAGIDPTTVSRADDKAIEQLSIRLEAMAQMDSQIQQIQGQQAQVQQQILNAQQAQQMGRVPSTVEAQAAQQAPVVEQQLVEAQTQQAAIVEDLKQNVSPLFKNLAKAIGKSDVQPIADVADDPKANLLTEVRKAGGISAGEGTVEKGELDRLGIKEAGTTGIISRIGGESADRMRERMASEGLTEAETPQQFIGEVEAATKKGKTEAESYADYQRGQMTEQEVADSDRLDEVLADKAHPFTQAYRALDNPKTIFTKDLAKKFDAAAQKAGFSDDFIERSLVEFQQQRGIGINETNRVVDEPGRSMAKPSKPAAPGVSMSPYKVLEANKKDLLRKLHNTNLNSKEGVAGVNELRDWARANDIEQRHVNAWISDIQNWQKKYGVPKNPDTQSSATRAPLGAEVKATQPARTEAAPASPSPSGFDQEQRKLLGRDHTNLLDSEFDEYMGQIENLQNMSVRGKEFGGFDINEAERKGLVSKLIEIRAERKKRVKAKRLPALTAPHTKATAPKAELGEQLVKQAAERETPIVSQIDSSARETTKDERQKGRSSFIGYASTNVGGRLSVDADGSTMAEAKANAELMLKQAIANRESKKSVEKLPASIIDQAAHEAATSPKNDLPEPTQAQIEAGNYKKGHISVHGLDVTIENPKGSTRSGTDRGGKKWEVEMSAHYGYIRRTEGADEEQIDVYIGPKIDSNEAFVVDQVDAETGEFDEHKVILGAETQAEAEKLYDAHFDDGKGPDRRGAITQMPVDEFKDWLKNEDTALPVSESLGEVNDADKTEPSGEKAERDGDAEVGQSPDGGLDNLFDEELEKLFGKEKVAPKERLKVEGSKQATIQPRTSRQAAKSATKESGEGLKEIAKGLSDLFGGSRLSSGLTFDEKTYAAAKPHFEAAMQHFAQAATDAREVMAHLLKALKEQFGFQADTLQRMKPYLVRFVQDQTEEAKSENTSELIPLPKRNSSKRIEGVLHTLHSVERIGELDFELWENEADGGMTMVTRDAETGDALPGSIISDTNQDRAKRRYRAKTEEAKFGQKETSKSATEGQRGKSAVVEELAGVGQTGRDAGESAPVSETKGGRDERSVDDVRLPESGLADQSGRSEPVTAKSERPAAGQSKPGSVVGKPAKSGKRRGLGKSSEPSLFGNEAEQTTEPSSSEHAQELVAEVAQETEPIAAGEAVIQAAVADLPEVAEESQPEEPQPKPVKTPKPKAQPLATLTSASFTITPDIVDQIRSGGAVTKYKQNVDAIKTMRQVLLEGRKPTVEEQETMALYAGFGGIKDLFAATGNTYEDRKKWFDRQQELKELIGEEAYKAASASTKNAHYTDPHIVTAMWSMAERLGFTKGRVLEPSMGSGNFLGLISSHLRDKATFTGVELDNTTGNIAKMLYPDANIHIQGFEDLKAPDGFFDLAIGNVPFGDYRISDNRYNKLLPLIHNYFFLKALDKVRPGGLVMFITSTGTMDSRRGEDIRKELAKQADLVSAMRFPAETFGKTALTSVVTDLIILRKRLPGETSKSDAWVKSSEVADPRGPQYPKIKLNNYFAENPSQILGDFNGNNRMYPGRANVDRTDDFEQRLAEAMANLPQGVMSEYATARQPRMKEAGMKAKEGGYIVKDGQLLQSVSGGLAEIDATPDRIKRVDGMLKIRDAFDDLIDAEMGRKVGGPAFRKALNLAYDAFSAKYGPISDKKNREALEGDPDLYRLMALEDYDAKKKIAKKQPIFTKSTVSGIRADAKPSNVVEAVAKSFQMNGEIVLSQLAEDLGLDERTIGEELVAQKIAFQTPNGNWELAPHYLSGNVRRKLAEAKIAAATDDFFQANVDALEQLLPRDIRSDEISVEMGAPWMEPQVISQFVAELFEDQPGNVGVSYDRHLGTFTLSLDRSRARGSRLAITTWGTPDLPFDKLLNLILTGKQAFVFDEVKTIAGTERRFNAEKTQAANTKLDAIKQRFREWVWEDDERKQKLLSKYNDLFNSHVPAEYNVEFLLDEKGEGVVPGLAGGWKLRKHQAAAVFRAVIEKRGLLAHEVGLGKTLAMIASASELKRLGIARKPAIAVPKKVLPGFVQAARSAFPLMKIHVIDSRDAAKRNTSMSQVSTGEHDLVLMTHDNMDMLKMKPEFEAEILQGELDEVTAVYNAMRGEKTSDKRLLKQIENRKSKLEAKLQDALKAERKDDTISFEDTGIDFLFVDEFHKYKSLPVVTALGQVKGVPTGDSQRAINMLMRARYLQQIQNGGGLIAATGTPVSNSLVEAWIMAKFLQPDLLEEAGVQSFDAWTRQFAETVPALEMGATGEWKQVSRLSKFKNLPELQTLARMTLDVKTAKETGILDIRPKRQDKVIQVPQDEAQAAFMQVLRERAAAVKARHVEPYEDNYLVISSDGMQMASDPRLVLPGYKAEGGKIKALADNVLRIYKEKPGTTQMIFSDSGVAPNAWGFHLYGEIINKLVEGGIPADKIINFSKMDTDAKVAKAQDRLNSGDAVIAIGHRENMGTGINAQQKMAAIHQFDVPWKPALVEQSEARGWRQGNENKEIEILSYVTEGSFDAIKWSTVARKQQAITAFMQKPQEGQARELEDADDDALSYDQIAAAASGDGDYLRKAELDAKVFKLDMMERSHNSEALNRKQEIPRIVDRIAALNRRATQMDLVAASAKEAKEKEFEYKTPKGEVVEDKKDAAKNLVSNYLFEKDRKERSVIGQYKGYRLMSDGYGSAYMELPMKGAEAEKVSFNVNTTEFIGTLQSLEKKVSALASNADADHLRETTIPNLEKDLENLRAVTDSPFPFTEQLTKAKRQLEAVNKRLKAKEAESVSKGQPLSAGDTDVRAVSALGRKIRRYLREKEIKPSDIPHILEKALPEIETQLRDQKDVWREFQRRKAEEFLAEHEGDTGLAGMAITAQSASRAQAAYDPKIDAAARAGKKPIGSNYWGTPRVQYDADGRAVDEASIIPNARAEFRSGGKDRSGTFWSNEQGAIVLGSAAELAGVKIGTVSGGFSGLAMSLQSARKALSVLKEVAAEYGPEVSAIVTEFEKAVVDAQKTGQSAVVIVDISSQPTLQEAKATAREERFHQWQRNSGLMEPGNARILEAALRDDPVYQHLRDYLLNVDGYVDNPSLLITEASAKIASGQWQQYGLETEQQGLNFLHRYMRVAVRLFGIKTLRGKVPGTSAARGVYQDVNDIEGPEVGLTGGSSANQGSERGNSGFGRDDSGLQPRQQSFGGGSQDGSGLPETAAAARHQFKPGQSSGKNIYDVTVNVYDLKAGKNRSKVVKVTADSRPEAMRRAEEQVSRSYPTIKAGGTATNRNVQGYIVKALDAKKDFEGQRYKDAVNDRRAIQSLSQQAIEAINKIAFAEAEAELQKAYREVLNELGQDSEIAKTLFETYRAMHKLRPGANVVNILNANEDAVSYLEGKIGDALRIIPEKQHAATSRREAAGPASELANPMDVLLHAETITKSRGSRGVRMYVNDHARAILGASLTEVFGDDYSNVNAINLSREEVKKVADYLETEAKGLEGDYKAGAEGFVADLRELLFSKNKAQRTFNIVDVSAYEARHQSGIRSDQERAAENLKGDIREEGFHWSQREVSGQSVALVGSSWAQSSKGFGKYRKALIRLGYPDDAEVLAAETAAKIAAGKFDDLGIRTEADHEQAQNWLASYFERVAEKHGVEALEKFDRLLPKAKEAKAKGAQSVKERLRERIEQEQAQNGGTNRPRTPGSQSEGVRGADEGGQKDGAQEVRDESSNAKATAQKTDSGQGGVGKPPPGGPSDGWSAPFEREPEQLAMFDEKGLPRKDWGSFWQNVSDVVNIPKAMRASADLSAMLRQGFYLTVPPSRWAKAARSAKASVKALVSTKQFDQFYKDLKKHPAYKDAIAAGLYFSGNNPLSSTEEQFGSRFAGKIPWAKYSEQAFKVYLDSIRIETFALYHKTANRQIKGTAERFESHQAAAGWINVSSGKGDYRGRFGSWYQEKAAPLLNVFGWAPGLVYSRFQMINPLTYAKNVKNAQHRVVFVKQMSELFQTAAVLTATGALALASGATISFDPDDADFLKLRFGTTRYDVLAGVQQVARLAIQLGEWVKSRAVETDEKKLKKVSNETTMKILRFGRTKLAPVPAFFVDWLNDWRKITGEVHRPGAFWGKAKEGEYALSAAELAQDPVFSQVMPLIFSSTVEAYVKGYTADENQKSAVNGLIRAGLITPFEFVGLGVQDYDRPEYSKGTRQTLAEYELDPGFPDRKPEEDERTYQKRVKAHIREQERVVNRFASDPNMIGQPKERANILLRSEISKDGIERLSKLKDEDIEDDRMVRAWIQVGVERMKADPVFQQMSEMEQKHAIQSYYGRMNKYKAQPKNSKHGYQSPDYVDENILQRKIKEAIKAQQGN